MRLKNLSRLGWVLLATLAMRLGAAEMGPVIVKQLPDALFLCVKRDAMPAEVAAFQREAIVRLTAAIAMAHLEQAGTLQFMGPRWNGMVRTSTYIIAIPVRSEKPVPDGVVFLTVRSHRVATMLNRGPGSSIAPAWDHLRAVALQQGLERNDEWTEIQLDPKASAMEDSLIELQLGLR
jgi:hypothetical protein